MEILFNKNITDSSEILEVLGINDADININHIWQHLRTASRKVKKIIGEDNYELAFNKYEEDNSDDDFCSMVRYAIALDAFRNYAPLTDLAFTSQGRAFRNDEHNKIPWEWQIEKSDEAMEKSYYDIVNEIIIHIIENEMNQSDFMQEFTGLFVFSLDEFQKFVNINDSYLLYYKLGPSLKLFEQREIINRTGARFTEFKQNKTSYIYTLIQNCCVYFAMADGIKKLSLQLFPEGAMKGEKKTKKVATGYDIEASVLYYKNELNSLLLDLENEVKKLTLKPITVRSNKFDENDGFVTL
ncbi:MAG: hypothetical protein J6O88_05840 [Chryseobacterium sp.]|uniref:DUF6712 family protein n=1 Tax=Chryseobacterium sp. TaxID=1871047 RepID=UPI001B0271B2|nr:DUF6712 family protein [Chryseobacterium sp.]MBO6184204.1 hypothetical protein [Chryseobacterium sp.]